jgi:prolyl-tRNA synthetase
MSGKVVKKDTSLLGIDADKNGDFGEWYQQVITRTEMIDYSDISGCYILRPWSYSIWECIVKYFDGKIKALGIQNAYFPIFVSARALNAEKDHVEGFAPEVAWVTKSGNSDLAEPIAIRPTSETIMYPLFKQWIRSWRDLPLRLNQWSNVVRWEFKHPMPFIRSREFLWQEGHTAFATKEEADREVLDILDLYRSVYEDVLCVPVVKGRKSEKEKFAGALYTTTVEAFIPTIGRAIQGATSHCLGQNFAKMFEVQFETQDGGKAHVWQNSWGLTTRTIGVMVMTHADNKGLVLPPAVAPIQIVIIPISNSKTDAETVKKVNDTVHALGKSLREKGFRVEVDDRQNVTPGFKYNHWEMRGVPLRIELGPRDLDNECVVGVRRDVAGKKTFQWATLGESVDAELKDMQASLLAKAKDERDKSMERVRDFEAFMTALDARHMALAPWCEEVACEEAVKKESGDRSKKAKKEKERKKAEAAAAGDKEDEEKQLSGAAKTLCIPFEQPEMPEGACCFHCGKAAKSWTLWGRSY